MNNTDKLLRAFIEASGYEIEETVTILDGQTVTEKGVTYGNQTVTSIDYKVTKKVADSNAHQVIFDTQGAEWSCIVKYITGHIDDIESSVNDFDTLKPMLDYFNGNS